MFIKRIFSFEISRFVLIGILNSLIGFLSFSIIYYLTDEEKLSLFMAYVFGILFNYKTYSKYVFTNKNKQIFGNFVIIYISIFLFNNYILYFSTINLGINTYISQLFAICIVTPILYIANKKYVFINEMESK